MPTTLKNEKQMTQHTKFRSEQNRNTSTNRPKVHRRPSAANPNTTFAVEAPRVEREPRINLEDIIVYNLPPQSLSYHLSMAAHIVMAVSQGYSLQLALAVVDMDDAARANVQRLCFDTMRHWGTARFWVDRAVSNPPGPWLQALLAVSLVQLHLEAESEFVLVHQAVDAAQNMKPHAKNMVNAILRKYLRERVQWTADATTNEVATWNYPQWWIDAVRGAYPNDWQNILTIGNSHPPMTLRVNAKAGSAADYIEYIKEDGLIAHPMQALSAQAIVLDVPCAVSQLPSFADGAVSVQDAAAQLAADLLDVQDNMRVLDACAAPGGKTCHILERYDVELVALEKDEGRAARIIDNLQRLDVNGEVLVVDANNVHQWWDRRTFDRVLLDAPCSASGIVRRHPDIRWLRELDDLGTLAIQQAQLLRTMWKTVAVGGRLLYCTCSIFPQEGEDIIRTFLERTPNAARVELAQMNDLQASMGQLLPTNDGTRNHDGFYYAALTKTAETV